MKSIEHALEIDAPTDVVWTILCEFDTYPEWNPFMKVDGSVQGVGDRLRIVVAPPGRKPMKFSPRVVAFDAGALLRWRGRLLLPGICDGTHTLQVEPLPGDRSRFTQHESFRGIVVPFMNGVLRDSLAGFAAMNEALKLRAEARVSV